MLEGEDIPSGGFLFRTDTNRWQNCDPILYPQRGRTWMCGAGYCRIMPKRTSTSWISCYQCRWRQNGGRTGVLDSGAAEAFCDLSGIEKPARNDGAPFSISDEDPGYDPVTGEMVIYRPWGSFTIFYGDFRHSNELVPLGVVESGLEVLSGEEDDFTGTIEFME